MMGAVSQARFVYDGDCGFCSASARFIGRHIPARAEVVAWQRVDLAEMGLTAGECAAAVQWVGADGRRGAGPVAVGYLLRGAGGWWRPLGWLLFAPPVRWLAWPVYRWVARHRDRLPGGTPACAVGSTDGKQAAKKIIAK
jgi:predicted DCC family thiol-disulfide oxidoreductase YuxK